ncbi:unnamed protein product, partial [Choristocarpus tenellus]
LWSRYFVGTYEARPGAGASDYTNPHPDYSPGSRQGDSPMGTLTSQTFTIGSTEISEVRREARVNFLIGGGCDDRTIFVELLVDGVGVAKATGDCTEEMKPVMWDVSMYEGRAGQIRVVDASSSSPWGHISVDEFDLTWEHRGGIHTESLFNSTANTTSAVSYKAHYTSKEDGTSRAGSAYVFSYLAGRSYSSTSLGGNGDSSCPSHPLKFRLSRSPVDSDSLPASFYEPDPEAIVTLDYCPLGGAKANCHWQEVAKLVASDRRGDDKFAHSLSVDHDAGLAIVGAPGASLTGLWLESPTVYTTTNPHGEATKTQATRVPLPVDPRNAAKFRFKGAYGSTAQGGSGAPAIWELQQTDYALSISKQEFNTRGNAQAGAVYVFKRHAELRDSKGALLPGGVAVWPGAEHFKLQAHDAAAADRFGSAVSYLA